nr:hypothetical protein P5656_03530 [Bacillus subtilis]
MTSAIGSYLFTLSPGATSHLLIVPSVTLSPSHGIVICSIAMILSSLTSLKLR